MRVICLSDSGRPEDIPLSYWIKKGAEYTVVAAYKDMNNVPMVEIAEIDLKSLGTLYKGFAASRFRPVDGFIDDLLEEIEEEIEEFEKRSCYAN